jgi:hypothetical protein
VIPTGTPVEVAEEAHQSGKSYVKLNHVETKQELGWTAKSNLGSGKDADASIAPEDKLPLDKLSGLDRAMAEIYNGKGAFLEEVAASLGCAPSGLAAILRIESSGHGFAADGRCIVRFENHIFHSQWGKSNEELFKKHFKFDAHQSWTGHQWRPDEGEWRSCHTSQEQEWETLEFARSLAEEGALNSASYGIGQIMGFNHAAAGFNSVKEMVDHMNGSIRPQLEGIFGFVQRNHTCLEGLRSKDYVKFATGYNGSGKAAEYGGEIAGAAAAYERVTAGLKKK